ncbi:hypothetical protein T4D_6215 [Trichinella pseudospiralis]|uniref:Uncharacterized protein n=1 Tax=Trichinella pseudospiralis TaxID=6337 RepID=A0A0V1FFR8_TRIPS|nr:hypothetical protein T4D_6215 [Trichinella pseudospiralis]
MLLRDLPSEQGDTEIRPIPSRTSSSAQLICTVVQLNFNPSITYQPSTICSHNTFLVKEKILSCYAQKQTNAPAKRTINYSEQLNVPLKSSDPSNGKSTIDECLCEISIVSVLVLHHALSVCAGEEADLNTQTVNNIA